MGDRPLKSTFSMAGLFCLLIKFHYVRDVFFGLLNIGMFIF